MHTHTNRLTLSTWLMPAFWLPFLQHEFVESAVHTHTQTNFESQCFINQTLLKGVGKVEGERLTSNSTWNFSKLSSLTSFLFSVNFISHFLPCPLSPLSFHLDLPVAEQTKEKISDSNLPMMLHPTARFHWSLLYPNHVKEGPLKGSILFHTLYQSQLFLASCFLTWLARKQTQATAAP